MTLAHNPNTKETTAMTRKQLNRTRRNLKTASAMGGMVEVVFAPGGAEATRVILDDGQVLEGRAASRWYPCLAYVSGSAAWPRLALG